MQKEANVHHLAMQYAPRVVRPYMPDQHREFYTAQPFMVAAARDTDGNMWSTLLMNHQHKSKAAEKDWLTSPDPQTLVFYCGPSPVAAGDALYGSLREGSDLGLLGIEFATKRRNRVNGRITKSSFFSGTGDKDRSFVFSTDQSFGNHPQYIQPRRWWTTTTTTLSTSVSALGEHYLPNEAYPSELTKDQIRIIHQAETIFTATGYRGEGNDVTIWQRCFASWWTQGLYYGQG